MVRVKTLGNKRGAFTSVELLAVIGSIAFVLAISMPALNSERARARTVVCATKMKQLAIADILYAQQYRTIASPWRFAFGVKVNIVGPQQIPTYDWYWDNFKSYVNYDSLPGDIRYKAFTTGDLYPFVKSGEVYVCPGIPKTGEPPSAATARAEGRHISGYDSADNYQPRWSYVNNGTPGYCQPGGNKNSLCINPNMVKPSPSKVFLFMEQSWDNYSAYDNTMALFGRGFTNTPAYIKNYDMSAAFHNGGGNLGFFDGHIQYMKQTDFAAKYAEIQTLPPKVLPDLFGGIYPESFLP